FFFSSRRRHTRFSRDWSSDVCSSDLVFLLMKITRMFGPASFQFTSRKDTLVKTKPLFSISSFIQQRVRWASKWKLHRSGKHDLRSEERRVGKSVEGGGGRSVRREREG